MTRISTPEMPIANGTPIPSTVVWTARRPRPGRTWYIALIEVRVVPSVSAMSAIRVAEAIASSASEPAPDSAYTTSMPTARIVTTNGFATTPSLSPNRCRSGPASTNRKAMATAFMTAV